jgi:hypothetical protein
VATFTNFSYIRRMTAKRDPIVSEFETEEEEASYNEWFRKKVEASLADPRPSVPHDEAMDRIRKTIEAARRKAC